MKKINWASQLFSFALPITVAGILPYLLVKGSHPEFSGALGILRAAAGVLLSLSGLYLLSWCVMLFASKGGGTLAPWDPPREFVARGPYKYSRNPMITGVLLIILGEALALASLPVFILFFLFFIINNLYFIFSEEPGLEKRFGSEYLKYKKSVPRWLGPVKRGR